MTTLTPPSSKVTLAPWQLRFYEDDARVQVVCWARQLGKDFTTAAKAVLDAMQTGKAWYIVSLTQRQADQTFAKCRVVVHFESGNFSGPDSPGRRMGP
ncbi:MAG: hypothetical protein AAF800_00615 [Planctomycetota bacterium]